MDLYCSRCGEPWDMDSVNHGDFTVIERDDFKAGKSCPACKDMEVCTLPVKCSECEHSHLTLASYYRCTVKKFKRPQRAVVASVLRDVLGDDEDGIAAEMEDFGSLFGDD